MAAIVLDFVLRQGGFVLEIHERLDARAVALFGPSGSGKTTVLDAIAGLRRPDEGDIVIAGHVLFSSARGIDLPPHERRVGYVPQDVALFPHMNARRNILYGRGRGDGPPLDRVLGILEIAPLVGRGVGTLSGGERQRVALARALMSAPDLLLLDEPLAAIDVELRKRILPHLRRVRDELGVPIMYVSHDREEVDMVADAVIEMGDDNRQHPSRPPAADPRL
jgi:molybdate transport system ATP-binding protein